MEKSQGFFKNHSDTLAIIGVNIAIGAIAISMWVSNTSRIDASNARLDSANARLDASNARTDALIATSNARFDEFKVMFYELLKENRK